MEIETRTLHRLTSYEPGREWTDPADDPRIVQDLVVNDFDRLPWFVKRYPAGRPRIDLPRELPPTTASTVDVLAGVAAVPSAPADLGRLLHLSAGIVRTAQRPFGTMPFRAAGSAGGRFPLEVYVVVPAGGPLPAGVHWYDPWAHALLQVGPAPTGEVPAIVVTGVPWRTGWRYRERGYRHIYWDLGTMLSQLTAAAPGSTLYPRFPDDEVNGLVGADGVHEFAVAVVALGRGVPALAATGVAAAGEVDAAPMEFPLVTAAQRASVSTTLGDPWPAGEPVGGAPAAPVEDVILARGSVRRMDPARSVPAELLRTSMTVALRGIDLPHFVAVHNVDGLEPGLYRWPDLTTPIRAGDLRDEMYEASLEQSLTRDAAFVVITAADVAALDGPGYRAAQLAAGLVEGRLHLLAYALGAGATGMTFRDTDIPGLLGEPLDAMLFTCVGMPEYRRTRPGGAPGTPRSVHVVPPR